MNWLVDKQALEDRIKNGQRQPAPPATLNIDAIEVVDTVFQHRKVSDWSSENHVKTLYKSLKNTKGKPFAPITVMWAGDAWALVDGHHRMAAYRQHAANNPVPVEVFEGTLDEAIGEALRANAHDKLPMKQKEKTNAAWRLVIGSDLSINKTAEISHTSTATIKTMRKIRDALTAKAHPAWVGQMDWDTARAKYDGLDKEIGTNDDWLDRKAERIAERLRKSFGDELSKTPKALWMALELYDPNLAFAFCEHHGIEPDFLEETFEDDDADDGNPDF